MTVVAEHKISGHGNYGLSIRLWQPDARPVAQIIMLHGVVSHSEWLAPLATRLAAAGVEVICPDRRGTGLNTELPGDVPNMATLVEDVENIRLHFHRENTPLHMAGFCWGGTYAIACLEQARSHYESLILIAPSVFPTADIANATFESGETGKATIEPNVPLDRFTKGTAYTDYIIPDPLRTRAVSPRFNSVLVEMNRLLAPRWAKLKMPNLMILATDDRMSDNEKHARAFGSLRGEPKRMIEIPSEHGLQFDAPAETVAAIVDWLSLPNFDN